MYSTRSFVNDELNKRKNEDNEVESKIKKPKVEINSKQKFSLSQPVVSMYLLY
jgi:hypothetical protein